MDAERWKRVDLLLQSALLLPSGQRDEFLRRECAGDAALEQEVRSLLNSHRNIDGFLEAPAIKVAAQVVARAEARESGNSMAGRTISHYRILKRLGNGGMGEVYEAEDLRLERRVALKFLLESLAHDPQARKRFEREARAASSLNHPNICTIYGVEQHDHQSVIVMELLEGVSLERRIREGPLSIDEVLDFGIQTCDALEAAHAKGIIHRDIKPGNMFIVGRQRMKILDFGLAKVRVRDIAEELEEEEALTLQGTIPGTASYMSPEQLRGEEIDVRSDLFSFGVVLYEMATGQRPFFGKSRLLTMNAILNAEPAATSKVNPALPAALDAIIARVLEKDREKRFQHAAEICSDLKRVKRESQGEKVAVAVAMAAPSRSSARPNLPVQRTGFVGREKEVAAATELLLRQDVRLVTVTGPGGIGKTRLAVQVASGLAERFPGGTHFVSLSTLNDPDLIPSAIIQTLGIREAGGQSPIKTLKKKLQNSAGVPMLLLLDNFEQLVQAASIVAEILVAGPDLKILVTSRSALHVYGEHEFPVPPLAMPDSRSESVEALSKCPAVALFVQRALAAKPDFELNKENASAITEICARLDGLPLAIELAAARVKVLSPAAMRTRLARRLQLLTGGAQDLPQRQQTLRAAMDWSYDLLSAAEQTLFRRLSAFVGGCNLEGAEAVCDSKGDLALDLLDGMASMVDKSLVQKFEQAQDESRFAMLETIREYAVEKLRASGEEALTRRAHAAYCLVLAEEASDQSGPDDTKWLERFALEHDNFRAALEWLTETGDAEWGLRLGAALFRFWEMREHLAEARDRLGKLLKLPGAAAPTKTRARALFAAGVLAVEQGDYAAADTLLRENLHIARRLDDKQSIAVSLNALAVIARDRGDILGARSLLEESLALWRELGDQKAAARCLSNLANVAKLQGDNVRARSLYAECLSIFQQLGDPTGVAWSMNYLGDVARDQGDSAAARALYEDGLAIFREVDDRWGIAGTLADLGSLAREEGDYVKAHSMYRESIRLFQELDHKRGIARLLECFACSEAAQLNAERSLILAGAAAALRQNIGAPLTAAEQGKLEISLRAARQALTSAVSEKAWLEGWALPAEKAIDELLMAEPAPSTH